MPIVGSFAGASARAYGLGAGLKIEGFHSIATTTVGSGGATDITFSAIPATYTHLQIRGITRNGSVTDTTLVQINGDTASNYSYHTLRGPGAGSPTAGGYANQTFIETPFSAYSGTTASVFGGFVLDILDYANTNKYKTLRVMGGADLNGSGQAHFNSGNWRNTNAITSIKVYPYTGSFAQYTSLALYGVTA
jgi:hypothetical protein